MLREIEANVNIERVVVVSGQFKQDTGRLILNYE